MTTQHDSTIQAARELLDSCQQAMRYIGVSGDAGSVLWNLIGIARVMAEEGRGEQGN